MRENYYRHYNQDLELEYLTRILTTVQEHKEYRKIIKYSPLSDNSTKSYLIEAYYLGFITVKPDITTIIELNDLGSKFVNSSSQDKKQLYNDIRKEKDKKSIQIVSIVSLFSLLSLISIKSFQKFKK